MRIAHIFDTYPNDFQRFNEKLILRQREQGIECIVFSQKLIKNSALAISLRLSIWQILAFLSHFSKEYRYILKIKKHLRVRLITSLRIWWSLRQLIIAKPDLIHIHPITFLRNEYISILNFLDIPFVISLRGNDVFIAPFLSADNFNFTRHALSNASGVHCVSDNIKETVIKWGLNESKLAVIRRSPEEINPVKNTAFCDTTALIRITTIGRLHWVKGFVYSLKAIKILKQRGINVSLNIIGEGSAATKEELLFWVHELDIAENIHFHGYLDSEQINEVISKTDIYIQPSLSEGIPNTLVRAITHRIPVVATKVGGIPEILADDQNGILVDRCDPEGLANGIYQIITDENLRERIKTAEFKNISLDYLAEIESYKQFYQKAIHAL